VPIPDLRFATKALTRLIQEHMRASPIWAPNDAPVVSPRPPDEANGDQLTLFLYHVGRDPALMSLPPPEPETRQSFTPLSLILSYQLAAHPTTEDTTGAEQAQLALSAAMLALYEHSVITRATRVGNMTESVFSDVGITDPDVVMRVSMQPVSQAEAVGFWTPGDSAARLAVYYQVAVQLEPMESQRVGPRVLGFGLGVVPQREPRLFPAEARLTLTRPGVGPEQLVLSPAEAAYGSRVVFPGSGLAGDHVELLLDSDPWEAPVLVGAEWGLVTGDTEASATVSETASGVGVPPGLYRAQLRVTRRLAAGGGESSELVLLSNPTIFIVTPAVVSVAGPDVDGAYSVTGRGFAHAEFSADETALTLLGQPLVRVPGQGVPAAGEYLIDEATRLRFRPSDEAPRGRPLPLRFMVRGASAPPVWVTLT
jgi:hypothetical protein